MSDRISEQMDIKMQECINNCINCHETCIRTVNYCLQDGKYAEISHIRLLLDCAEICQTSANFMIRSSEFHVNLCTVCAEVCERCTESCEQMEDDEQMKTCAQMCRTCANSCRRWQLERPTN